MSTRPLREQHHSCIFRLLQMPSQIILLNVPRHYFRLVGRALSNAQLSPQELDRLTGSYRSNEDDTVFVEVIVPQEMTAGFERMRRSWGGVHRWSDQGLENYGRPDCVHSLVGSFVSCAFVAPLTKILSCSAMFVFFKSYGFSYIPHPITRATTLLSCIFSGWSFTFTALYVVRFNGSREVDKASRWVYVRNSFTFVFDCMNELIFNYRKRRRDMRAPCGICGA